ncbi:hypothetical protein F4680DRAFT_437437 [Xylaria scruposa]|nr:hypothetical protein F4680DRAFT_437437 [Xylaria scruposa]
MAKFLMKLLAVPALLGGVAKGIQFLNDIPVNAYYEPGTEFVLEWTPEDRTDTFNLTLDSFLANPIIVKPSVGWIPAVLDFKYELTVLNEAVKFSDGSYTWVIDTIDNRTGADYYYSFGARYTNTYESPRAFHLNSTA